jgi:hypothetical protein
VPRFVERTDGAEWMHRRREAALLDGNDIALDDALKTVATLRTLRASARPLPVSAPTHVADLDGGADEVCGVHNHYRELSCSYLSLATILSQ